MNAKIQHITSETPLKVYGSVVSYYTGKLEAYLRAKGIPYVLEPFSVSNMQYCERHTGLVQIPQVECADGSWLVDTSLIIEYFERTQPEPQISPQDPVMGFVSRLIEDYADEWLWRPAMHYRWSYAETARLMSGWLSEHLGERRIPQWMKRRWWYHRQYGTFVRGDGVTSQTRAVVESSYLEALDALEAVFVHHPFILGPRPSEADFGMFGPMFRHFFCDPNTGRIMRERAPGVMEWVARMWNLRPEKIASLPPLEQLPVELGALLNVITQVYLPYLEANAQAYAQNQKQVRYTVRGTPFEEPVKPYRVWCRDRLQRELCGLDANARVEVERVLANKQVLESLAIPSPLPVPDAIGELPITQSPETKSKDSWWRS